MSGVPWQTELFIIIFFLGIVLGLQIQITSLYRELEDAKKSFLSRSDTSPS